MPIKLWSTFRLKDNRTYSDRYNALMTAFGQIGSNFWEEPTSFLAFDTDYDIDQVASHLKQAIDPTCDVIVLRQIGSNSSRVVGYLEAGSTFRAHFPEAKKV